MNIRNTFSLIPECLEIHGLPRDYFGIRWNARLNFAVDKINTMLSAGPLNSIDKAILSDYRSEYESLMRDTWEQQYYQQPRVLFVSLIADIRQHVAMYEKSFPVGQSSNVQLYLYHIEAYLGFMEKLPVEEQIKAQNVQQRNLYVALCGMMRSILDKVDNPDDQALAQSIIDLLFHHNICKQDCLDEYDRFCNAHRNQLPAVTPSMVTLVLQKRFDEMKKQLGRELNHCSRHTFVLADLKNKARDVMAKVVCYKLECDSAKKPFDYKLYSSLLAVTKQLIVNPANNALKADYEYLMSLNKQGVSSPEQMIVGAMLAFVGVLAIAAAFFVEGVPLKVVGFATTLVGVTMFCGAQSYGTTSATRDFSQEVDRYNHRRAASIGEQRGRDEKSPLLVGMRRL